MLKRILVLTMLCALVFAACPNLALAVRWQPYFNQPIVDGGKSLIPRAKPTVDYSRLSGGAWAAIQGADSPTTPDPRAGDPSASSPANPPFDGDRLLPESSLGTSNNEPTIVVNPLKPNNLVAGYHDYAALVSGAGCVWSYSFDGGHTWTYGGVLPVTTAGDRHSDPVLAADEYGNFYYNYMSIRSDGSTADIVVAKSTDGGVTFPTYSIVYSGVAWSTIPDKNWIDVDTWPDSPYRGRIYVTYTRFYYTAGNFMNGEIWLHYSWDRGSSWSSGVFAASSLIAGGEVQGSQPSAGPDGTMYVALLDRGTWPITLETGDERVTVVRSSNGGFSIDLGPVIAVPTHGSTRRWGIHPSNFRGESFPFIDVGPEGNVYVTYAHDPGNTTPGADDDGDIGLTVSTNLGVSWTNTWKVNDDATTRDQWWPAIKVEEDDGTIHLIWLDRRLDPADTYYHTYYAYSTDAGSTFPGSDVRISTVASNPGADSFFGDYIDVDASPYRVHAIWTDKRTTNENIYASRGWKRPLGIAVLSSTAVNRTVLRTLEELGYVYDYYYQNFPDNYERYNVIIQAMNGGLGLNVSTLATFIQAGGRAILFGGSALPYFVDDVNTYLMPVNTTYYEWVQVTGTPDITIVNPDHWLARDLPATYNFVTSGASYYHLRILDPPPEVVAINGDGYRTIVTKKLGYGRFSWFINPPSEGFWTNPTDYNYLKTFLRNALEPANIAVITSTNVDQSVMMSLGELGYDYDYYRVSQITDFPFDYASYRVIIQAMDGGVLLQIPWLADYVATGGQAIVLGGSNWAPFVQDVDTYMMHVNTTYHSWTQVAGTPDITIVTSGTHWLARDLPATYDFVASAATFYQLRIIESRPHVVARNGDGYRTIVTKPLGHGRFSWFINSPYTSYWTDPGDYNYLKTFLRNALRPLGDVSHDHVVDQMDLSLISEALWTSTGDPGYNPAADLNGDGVIDINDIILFHNYWKHFLFD